MRNELLEHLRTLADVELQQSRWVQKKLPPGIQLDDLDCIIHFLFDDTPQAEDPERAIDYFLKDKAEALAVTEVVAAINKVFDAYGTEKKDEEFISTPEWSYVVGAAQRAYEAINRADEGCVSTGRSIPSRQIEKHLEGR